MSFDGLINGLERAKFIGLKLSLKNMSIETSKTKMYRKKIKKT